ncbi:hypothetical protein TRIUR3_10615 [Triticum urartu]|uniref:Uncharacterized protein n=1 Tax=Triticum urartu TaxID=4572 RepID=M8B4P8_TRIUA|nr:hypothetical protein TRIUR3_10615 [Triticum urartu]
MGLAGDFASIGNLVPNSRWSKEAPNGGGGSSSGRRSRPTSTGAQADPAGGTQDPVGGVALRRRAMGIGSLDGIHRHWKKTSAGLRRGKVEEELAAL